MNIAIDFGNTFTKVGIFEDDELKERLIFQEVDDVREFLSGRKNGNLIISSVAQQISLDEFSPAFNRVINLSHTTPVPVSIGYGTPGTLGVDRIAGVCGAFELFPGRDCLVIDAGSCITYDFVDATGRYSGGAISPGLSIRFQALHKFTAKLPLIQPVEEVPLTGNSTDQSIQSGVINGITFEIEGFMSFYKNKYPGVAFILCGGDTAFFENKLKQSIFACPDLVLHGLNGILKHNVR